jgi:hypothetical protein
MNNNNLIYTYYHKQDKMTILGCTPCRFCQLKVIEKDGKDKEVVMICKCIENCISLNKFEKMQ